MLIPAALPYLCFAAVWLAALLLLMARGLWTWVGVGLAEAAVLGLFVWLTVRITEGGAAPEEGREDSPRASEVTGEPAARSSKGRLAVQLAAAVAFAILSISELRRLPGWGAFVRLVRRAGEALGLPHPYYLENPILYVAVPGAAVLLLGAGLRELGFRKGHRSWRVIALWSAPVVAGWVYYLIAGSVGVVRVARRLLANTLMNGFSEEFLWRGVIQTRISRLWTPEWGLVLASLGFGWWHLLSIADWAGTDLWLAAALNAVVQAPMGLALGVVFQRTRNLLAPSVVHVVANAVEL